jgi:hypothetical protein
MAKPDLNKLIAEIDRSKRERGVLAENIQGARLLPKDKFLHELVNSLDTGVSTQATKLIKIVENKTAERMNETPRHNISREDVAVIQPQPRQRMNEVDMSPERDEQLYRDLENKRRQTLADSMQGYINTPAVGSPMSNQSNYGLTPPQGMQLNEAYLTENVKKIVNGYLVENFGPIVEEAIKNTILEMYAVERIKEVLTENKEIIKTLVYETIREIQAKSKKAQ